MSKKLSIAVLALAALVAIGMWGWSLFKPQVEDLADIQARLPADLDVDVSVEGITLSQGKDGKELWTLQASSATYDTEDGSAELENPEIVYFGDSGEESARIVAPRGTVDRETDTMTMYPDVTAFYGEVIVRGERLVYQGKTREITITGNATVDRGDVLIQAPRLVIDLTTRDMRAMDGVEVETTMRGAAKDGENPK
ncbi:LPS export ABC transporter periplasmic protein LptC [Desulfohalovibrio reitneri]|uniref:LPS export ABC transporter periplasmic protein LptC n=1 Tax=Desulfohalovibrio reitneri TaxID=1307759 RepID=UPI00054D809A|nr:LPS export ABC transporter periplasmic protein LptC [Desulfohalovibrio reitneri]